MKKVLLALVVFTVIASGCSSNSSTDEGPQDVPNGEFQLYISDSPVDMSIFSHVNVSISEARLVDQNGSITTLNVDETVDLTELQGEKAKSVRKQEVGLGSYQQIELEVSNVKASASGFPVEVKVPSEKLQIDSNIFVAPGNTTKFVFDIQLVQRGNDQNSQGYILRPSITASGIAGEDVEIEAPGQSQDQGQTSSDEEGSSGGAAGGAPGVSS